MVATVRPGVLVVPFLLLPAFILSASAQPRPANPTVNCGVPGADLQAKLDTAPSDSIVWITGNCNQGPYRVRRKSLEIRAFDGAVLSAAGGDEVLHVDDAARVSVVGVTIDATGVRAGVVAFRSHVTIQNVTLHNATTVGLHAGIGSNVSILRSQFTSNRGGVNITEASSAVIVDSSFRNHTWVGVHVVLGSSAVLDRVTAEANHHGVFVGKNGSMLLIGSTIMNNTGHGLLVERHGFLETLGSPSTVEGNSPTDINCGVRGIIEVGVTFQSATGAVNIGDCVVLGSLF